MSRPGRRSLRVQSAFRKVPHAPGLESPDQALQTRLAFRSGWSVRQLDRQIASQFHERLSLSKNKATMVHARGGDQRSLRAGIP
jgi:hypothetical protein